MNKGAPVLIFLAALMVWTVFVGIRSDRERQRQPQPGACVVHAAEEAAKHADARILLVRYNEVALGHAYCVYREGGQLFAWDWRGPVALDTPDAADDAMNAAIWLTLIDPPLDEPLTVRSAAYGYNSLDALTPKVQK